LLRVIFFTPYILSEAITAVVFLQILQPNGLVDEALRSVGLGGLVQLWLADLGLVFYTLFVVITWKYVGFSILLFLAGLQGVPSELHEAAAIDGATSWQTLRYVTLPLLGPTVRLASFLAIIGSIQLFDIVWIMTLGGPAGASSTMASYMIDQGINSYRIGYATAVAVSLFAICFVVSLLYQLFVIRRDFAGASTRMAG
jgi:raffinose/stachyose/melibiose transport system permease protein